MPKNFVSKHWRLSTKVYQKEWNNISNHPLSEVLTCPEAAKMYEVTEDKLKRLCREGEFTKDEARKAGKYWLVTKHGMERIFGKRGKTLK